MEAIVIYQGVIKRKSRELKKRDSYVLSSQSNPGKYNLSNIVTLLTLAHSLAAARSQSVSLLLSLQKVEPAVCFNI